jgi:type I restriction enzyme, R subunit
LVYRNHKLAVVEAKAIHQHYTGGLAQAKAYAKKLGARFAYSTNGKKLCGADIETGLEGEVVRYPTPEELWNRTFAELNVWRDRFALVPFEDKGGSHPGRYYQDTAVNRVLEKIANNGSRILLTLATGTSREVPPMQVVHKLVTNEIRPPMMAAVNY